MSPSISWSIIAAANPFGSKLSCRIRIRLLQCFFQTSPRKFLVLAVQNKRWAYKPTKGAAFPIITSYLYSIHPPQCIHTSQQYSIVKYRPNGTEKTRSTITRCILIKQQILQWREFHNSHSVFKKHTNKKYISKVLWTLPYMKRGISSMTSFCPVLFRT